MSRNKPHKSWSRIILTLLFTGALISLAGYAYLVSLLAPINPQQSSPTSFVVNKGDSTTLIGKNLTSAGLVRTPFAFRLAVYLEDLGGQIQAGQYQLAKSQSARALAKTLTKGIAQDNALTIPEGFRLEQIAVVAEATLGIPYADFLVASEGLEGYLFPDTYALKEGTTATELVAKLRTTWDKKTATLPRAITTEDLILASIVERETLTNAEKPVVAGILKKRLAEGWALEVDATIQYMLGTKKEWWPVPLLGDRKLASPYNTYQNLGLPPAPICNPGLASLAAVISPEASPYYFYLHAKDGSIHYAATNAEHESNINKYIRQ